MADFSDNFDRSNTTPIVSAGAGLGSNWTDTSGGGTYYIASNKATKNDGDHWAKWVTACSTVDQYVEADVANITTGNAFVWINLRGESNALDNCYLGGLVPSDDHAEIGKVVGGSYSTVINQSVGHSGSGTIRIEAEGVNPTTLRFYYNDVLKFTTTDSDVDTGNYVGINCFQPTTGQATFDNWSGGDFTAATTLTVANGAHAQGADGISLYSDTAAIATSSTDNSTSLGSANAIPAPSGVVSGNLLIAFVSNDNPSTTNLSASTGWTAIGSQVTLGSNVHKMAVFGRVADGGANDALSLSGAAQDFSAAILRITNHVVGSGSVGTDVKIATTSNTTAGNIDPPNLDASTTRAWLWLAAGCADLTNSGDSVSAMPSNYTQVVNLKSASSNSSTVLAIAQRGTNAQTENPGTFTNTSRQYIAMTLAVPGPIDVTLTVADAAHAHAADNVIFVADLVVGDAAHAHSAAEIIFAVDLVVADAAHAQAADNVDLVQTHNLAVDNAAHAQAADNLDLVQDHNLAVDNAAHAHAADNVDLAQIYDAAVADAAHAHSAENLDLVQNHVLAVDAAAHAHTADNLDLVQAHNLAVNGAEHDHEADEIVLVQTFVLTVNGAEHDHEADEVELVQSYLLVVADAAHAHSAEEVTLGTEDTLGVANASHAHSADNVELVQNHVLVVAAATHDHDADEVTLVVDLVVAAASHAHSASTIDFGFPAVDLVVDSATHDHDADEITLVAFAPGVLAVADAFHDHEADEISLAELADADDAQHFHSADIVVLTQEHNLVVDDAAHGHQATSIGMFPSDTASGVVDIIVFVDTVSTVAFIDEIDTAVLVDRVDVTIA